jgi:hypothetical protein
MDSEKVLVNADAASRGAAMAHADAESARAAEKKARERLQKDRQPGGLKWWGVPPAGSRGDGPRPGCTYRDYRRNAARLAHWPDRYRARKLTDAQRVMMAAGIR